MRAAILDGAVPAEVALGPDVAIEAQRAIDSALQRCARDTQCARQFPQVPAQFAALQESLRKQPVSISIPHPRTGSITNTTLDVARFGAAVRLLSYADETVSTLPLLIHEAQSLHEPQALAAQYLRVASDVEEQIAEGMHFAVVCSEDAPRWAQQNVTDEQLAKTYLGTAFMSGMRAVCEEWPRGPVDADFGAPLQSERADADPVRQQRPGDAAALRGADHEGSAQRQASGRGRAGPRATRDRLPAAADRSSSSPPVR